MTKDLYHLDRETAIEMLDWAKGMYHVERLYWRFEVVPAGESTIRDWYKLKTYLEGEPPDDFLIRQIGDDGEIQRPVVYDITNEMTVEGRHRLAAALKYKLDVPAILMSKTRFTDSTLLTGKTRLK